MTTTILILQLLSLSLGIVHCTDEDYLMQVVSEEGFMTSEDVPTPGTESPDTVYIPGTPGGAWDDAEVETTRRRVLMTIYPEWEIKREMGIADSKLGRNVKSSVGQCTENVIMRLVFHDCIPYTDGTGGCDGCMNWQGMDAETPDPNKEAHKYKFDPVNATDNKGLDGIAEKLELIYTTVDWPFRTPSLNVSLKQSGKSRADLWQFAGLVALEQSLERSNRACDLDKWGRQQTSLLESREACEIKLTKPFKFKTGRSDCVPTVPDPEGRGYITTKPEDQPRLMGDARHLIDYGRNLMGVGAEGWAALQAVHGAVHAARIGLKYTWMGPGYISNMYFKMIANKPTYRMINKGGDLSFYSDKQCQPIVDAAVGTPEGEPVAMTGWRASCMYLWNTTEGGPCVLRPIPVTSWDAPANDNLGQAICVTGVDEEGGCIIDKSSTGQMERVCKSATCDKDRIVSGMKKDRASSVVDTPWHEGATDGSSRHSQGWNNAFAFPWEVGMYWNFTTASDAGQRAVGCPGLDEPFGEVPKYGTPNWPYKNSNSPIFGSPAMDCATNDYKPDGEGGRAMSDIIAEFAEDNEVFAEKFMEGWQDMTSNGYAEGELQDGPESSWFGHYSLSQKLKKQGGAIEPDFETYIENNKPVWFTDGEADPWICGHRGHAAKTCGIRFKEYYSVAKARPECFST